MSLKNDNSYTMMPKSIRMRLTLFYSLAVFVLLSLAAIFLYWITISLLYKADFEFLTDEAETIQYIMQSDPIDKEALHEAVTLAPFEEKGSIYHYFIRISDKKDNVVMQTPGAEQIFSAEVNHAQSTQLLGKKRTFWYTRADTDYLLIQSPLIMGDKQKTGFVEIALDVSYQHDLIHDRTKIIAALLIGTLLSLLFGFFIANRGLRSLFLLTETVQRITATSLDQRINPKSWPTELMGIGKAFNQMLDRMEASFTRLKQFSADLSHELRTPITNLIGSTEISLSYDHTVEDYRRVMESNLEELQRISSLIENILFLAKAENPQFELKKTTLHVLNEIALVGEFYQAMAEEKNIQVTYSGDAEIYANADMFRRMISNVLSNALKYTPDRGSVHFMVSEQGHAVKIIIKDTGVGIAKENIPKLFDRFYRTDSARSQKIDGMGLGMAIVKSIVEIHGGTISVASELGQGTEITILLPRG